MRDKTGPESPDGAPVGSVGFRAGGFLGPAALGGNFGFLAGGPAGFLPLGSSIAARSVEHFFDFLDNLRGSKGLSLHFVEPDHGQHVGIAQNANQLATV